jgi:hypothetical protein
MMDQIANSLPPPALEDLAHRKFGDLTEAERKMLRALPDGVLANCGDPAKGLDDPANDPEYAGMWDTDHEIRAALIRWLCVNQDARRRIDAQGIVVQCAKIHGLLDLSFVSVDLPLVLLRCWLVNELRLTHADLLVLALNGTHAQRIQADGLRVKGDVVLAEGFRCEEKVSLIGSEIGGSLICFGGHFRGVCSRGRDALVADGARIKGSVHLTNRFRAEGQVHLAGVRIGGNLECDAGNIVGAMENRARGAKVRGTALQMVGTRVEGSVFLRNGFSAEGEVNLTVAKIGGALDCAGASFCGDVQILPGHGRQANRRNRHRRGRRGDWGQRLSSRRLPGRRRGATTGNGD